MSTNELTSKVKKLKEQKTKMNREILDQIYNAIHVEEKADNPFETMQTDTPYEAFYKKYIKPLEVTDLTRCNDMWIAFGEALCAERKQAFKI